MRASFEKQMNTKRAKWEALSTEELGKALVAEKQHELAVALDYRVHLLRLFEEFNTEAAFDRWLAEAEKVEVAERMVRVAERLAQEWSRREFLLHFVEGRMWVQLERALAEIE